MHFYPVGLRIGQDHARLMFTTDSRQIHCKFLIHQNVTIILYVTTSVYVFLRLYVKTWTYRYTYANAPPNNDKHKIRGNRVFFFIDRTLTMIHPFFVGTGAYFIGSSFLQMLGVSLPNESHLHTSIHDIRLTSNFYIIIWPMQHIRQDSTSVNKLFNS